MLGKKAGEPKRPLKLDIPPRANVALVGRTSEACEEWERQIKPLVERAGGSLKVIAQLHDLEDMARHHYEMAILVPGMDPTARETVVWTAKRGNSNIVVIELPA